MATFPPGFFFGVSNAAGQVEDQLNDTWLAHARAGRITGFQDTPQAEERLKFWSTPELELDLAQNLGVQVFRLSLAWERLVPAPGVWDETAAARYQRLLAMIAERGMKAMVTLFHHAIPPWMQDESGWVNARSMEHFRFYSQKAHATFAPQVSWWITLNEPVPWSFLTYTEGLFPPGKHGSWWHHHLALTHMAHAHREFYQYAQGGAPVGIAHHMGQHQGRGLFNSLISKISDQLTHWRFLESVRGHMDFFGINYYGAEWMTLRGPAQYLELEYSDAGRAVSPQGLAILLTRIAQRFPDLPIIITENGVGDGTDQLRPAYLCEHLAAVQWAIKNGVRVAGYVHWTLSDNWEWSDGYGPKFGLVAVDRAAGLRRSPRPSFELYQRLIQEHALTPTLRQQAWQDYRRTVGQTRPYWRGEDGKSVRSTPLMRVTPDHDWRFKF